TNLSKEALSKLYAAAKNNFGEQYAESHVYATKSKSAQEAHEAIRPTDPNKKSVGNTPDEKRLYDLIWQRSVASQMKAAKILRTKITASFGDKWPDFSATGSRVVFPGWLICDVRARGEDVELPAVKTEDPLELKDINAEGK